MTDRCADRLLALAHTDLFWTICYGGSGDNLA